jgi:hypothetical protein
LQIVRYFATQGEALRYAGDHWDEGDGWYVGRRIASGLDRSDAEAICRDGVQ